MLNEITVPMLQDAYEKTGSIPLKRAWSKTRGTVCGECAIHALYSAGYDVPLWELRSGVAKHIYFRGFMEGWDVGNYAALTGNEEINRGIADGQRCREALNPVLPVDL